MVKNRKVTGRAMGMPLGLAVGAGVSMGCTLVLSVLTAKVLDCQWMPESKVGYAALGILLLSTILGAEAAWGRIRRRRLLVCGASAGIYYGLLLCVTALFFGGQYTGMGVTALVIAGGCAVCILMGNRRKQGRGHKKKTFRR